MIWSRQRVAMRGGHASAACRATRGRRRPTARRSRAARRSAAARRRGRGSPGDLEVADRACRWDPGARASARADRRRTPRAPWLPGPTGALNPEAARPARGRVLGWRRAGARRRRPGRRPARSTAGPLDGLRRARRRVAFPARGTRAPRARRAVAQGSCDHADREQHGRPQDRAGGPSQTSVPSRLAKVSTASTTAQEFSGITGDTDGSQSQGEGASRP